MALRKYKISIKTRDIFDNGVQKQPLLLSSEIIEICHFNNLSSKCCSYSHLGTI